MLSSDTLLRSAMVAMLIFGTGTLGACSFSPVYGDAMLRQASALELAFAKPTNRLEQVIYQELALRFGRSPSSQAALATVTATAAASDMVVTTTANPAKPVSVTVTATLVIAPAPGSNAAPARHVRTATAEYSRSGQVLADNAAAADAAERAARSAAESLRLAILAAQSR